MKEWMFKGFLIMALSLFLSWGFVCPGHAAWITYDPSGPTFVNGNTSITIDLIINTDADDEYLSGWDYGIKYDGTEMDWTGYEIIAPGDWMKVPYVDPVEGPEGTVNDFTAFRLGSPMLIDPDNPVKIARMHFDLLTQGLPLDGADIELYYKIQGSDGFVINDVVIELRDDDRPDVHDSTSAAVPGPGIMLLAAGLVGILALGSRELFVKG